MGLALTHPHGPYGFGGVLIGTDVTTGDDVIVDHERRVLGVAMVGRSGSGKSSLMEHLILEDLANGTPGIVIDPHGMMADRVISLAPSSAAHRIVLLDPSEGEPFGLNLLARRQSISGIRDDPVTWAADSVVETVKKLYGEADEYLPRLERYLNLAARTLIPNGLTLVDALRLFEDEAFRERCLKRVPNKKGWQDRLRRRWKSYSQLRPGDRESHVEALVNRLERLFDSDLIYSIVSSPATTVPFDDVLDGDTMLIVRLPHEILGEERCNFIGAMLLCAIADRIFVRSLKTDPLPVHLYLDEYQRFATTTTRQLLTQGRKFGAGVTLALQDLSHIKDVTVRDACRHAGTLIVLGVTWPDAELLVGEFPIKPTPDWYDEVRVDGGTEPIKVVSQEPIRDLLSEKPHEDEFVRLLVSRTLRPLQETINRLRDTKPADRRSYSMRELYEYPVPKIDMRRDQHSYLPDVQEAYNSLRQLLVDVMEHRLAVLSNDFLARVTPIVVKLAVPALGMKRKTVFEEGEQLNSVAFWVERYAELVLKPHVTGMGKHDRFALKFLEEMPGYFVKVKAIQVLYATSGRPAPSSSRLDELVDTIGKGTDKEPIISVLRWFHALCLLSDRLSDKPVLTNSGQEQVRKQVHLWTHQRQPEHDAQLALARKLVSPTQRPGQYRGHVRLPGGQYHEIELVEPVSGIEDVYQLEEIRNRSRELCAVSPEDEPDDEPPDDEPPMGRRPRPR